MRKIAIVGGYLIGHPLGGHAMSILHWLVGLRQMGYEVVFVEAYEWSNACYNPVTDARTDDPSYGIAQLREMFARCGLSCWCYVDKNGVYHGTSQAELARLCRDSELMISLWTVTWVEEFRECSRRVFIDTDPGFTQFSMLPTPARSCVGYASPLDFHHCFSYGSRIGKPGCPIPTHAIEWLPLRPPVALELLPVAFEPDARHFTTVMSWSSRTPIVYQGEEYGQKDIEFWKVADLPSRAGPVFEIALAGEAAPRDQLISLGWKLTDPKVITRTPWTYRDYISQSRGEFSVAVNLEVKARSGWFSDRTAAYLASGKPVIVQDTGFSESLPCGQGLFAFQSMGDILAAIESIATDYQTHARAARDIAEEYFASEHILGTILQQCGIP